MRINAVSYVPTTNNRNNTHTTNNTKTCHLCKYCVPRKSHELPLSGMKYLVCSNWMGTNTVFPLSNFKICGKFDER
jgi:hypothetical protein